MATALGTDHSAVLCRPSDIGANFPDVIRHAERPILRTAPAPLELLSGLVREEGFKVVLTGEGADEVFGGYDIFKEAKLRRFCARAAAIAPPSAALPKALSVSAEAAGAVGGLSEGLLRDRSRCGRRSAVLASAALPHDGRRKALLLRRAEARRSPATTRSTSFAPVCRRISRRWHPLSQAQYLETAYLLPGYILSAQGDRMAMANAVEGRFPFLDHRVVELAASDPAGAEASRPHRKVRPPARLRAISFRSVWRSGRSSPTARRTARPSSARRSRPMSSGCSPRRPYRASGLFDRRCRREARRQGEERTRRRLPRQHRADRHPVDAALARSLRARRRANQFNPSAPTSGLGPENDNGQ